MQSLIRLLPFAAAAAALAIIAIGPSSVVTPEASANEGQISYWDPTVGAEGACDFLEVPWEPDIHYLCVDWISETDPPVTCCIKERDLLNYDLGDCLSVIWMPTVEERPGL